MSVTEQTVRLELSRREAMALAPAAEAWRDAWSVAGVGETRHLRSLVTAHLKTISALERGETSRETVSLLHLSSTTNHRERTAG
jgi:hypothetical protein